MKNKIINYLDEVIPNPKCPLNYNHDYELLIATVLSAQCTDNMVNKVTKELFSKYDVYDLAKIDTEEIKNIIKPCGNMNIKSVYIKEICKSLVKDYNGSVPNDRKYLESLKGVGRKTASVVLNNLFNEPAFAVDTHVERVSKRLGIAFENDTVSEVEEKLNNLFPMNLWGKLHHQFIIFGRLYCASKNPKCDGCKLKEICTYKNAK